MEERSGLLDDFIRAVEAIEMYGIIVKQEGKTVGKHLWMPEERTAQYSVSKSVTSAAIGLAVSEGLLEIDVPVKVYIPEMMPKVGEVDAVTFERLQRITLRHLMTMTHGHKKPYLMERERSEVDSSQWAVFALRQPIVHEPGEVFVYNNAGPYLAAVVLQEVVGMSMVDYLQPRLFVPLGIPKPEWDSDAQGRNFGASGLMLSLGEMVKFGQLYLQEGKWEGKILLDPEWIKTSVTDQIKDETRSYGLGFWLGPEDIYRADGKYSQYIIVMPSKKAVIAITAKNETLCNVFDLVMKYIVIQ